MKTKSLLTVFISMLFLAVLTSCEKKEPNSIDFTNPDVYTLRQAVKMTPSEVETALMECGYTCKNKDYNGSFTYEKISGTKTQQVSADVDAVNKIVLTAIQYEQYETLGGLGKDYVLQQFRNLGDINNVIPNDVKEYGLCTIFTNETERTEFLDISDFCTQLGTFLDRYYGNANAQLTATCATVSEGYVLYQDYFLWDEKQEYMCLRVEDYDEFFW